MPHTYPMPLTLLFIFVFFPFMLLIAQNLFFTFCTGYFKL
nr:ATP synthase F0 subunit 8 [Parachordodes pustulosus]WQH58891.1 ATP synthase F0 subunit 8 [Parachordodes pustulosus]